jgi:uncharacterized cupin superfamily protein
VPVLRGRPELGVHAFPQLGVTLAVIEPGRPVSLYHAGSAEEGFLVLPGACRLIVEREERIRARPTVTGASARGRPMQS